MILNKIMKELEAQGILITDMINVRYFTGFTGTTGVALILGDKRYFLTDFRYEEQGKKEVVPKGFQLVREDKDPVGKAGEIIKEAKIKKLAIEDGSVTLSQFRSFEKNFGHIEYAGIEDKFLKARMVKTEEEIKLIKEATKIADKAFENIKSLIKEGISEERLATELEYEMKKLGAEGPSFDTIIASNYRSAMPHGVASEKKLQKEGFVKFDFGCFYKGYVSDMTRTVYLGENPTEKHYEIYDTVKKAQQKAIEAVRAGITTRELDKIARDYITEKGYGECFGHGLGHGIGLEIHEYPYLSYKAEDLVLEENMVVTIEPGIYIEGFGGVRIEDDVVVKKDGCEVLNKTTKEFVKL
jgi:Xaa-Pro aminopeptidase